MPTVTTEPALKRTPLWSTHRQLGARLVEFGGWEMPVQYTSIVEEHQAVRQAAGLFDISHMGEILVSGPAALDFLNATLTNDLRKCEPGRGQYTLLCNADGGVLDDLYIYRLEPLGYLLVVNAARIPEDARWLEARLADFPPRSLVTLVNASDQRGAVAIQGPKVNQFIDRCWPGPAVAGQPVRRPTDLQKNQVASFKFMNSSVWVARTGYTGEDGFEVVAPAELLEKVWASVWEAGEPFGLRPCGLGARDSLRTEMGYPLYGHELDERTTPLEAGLGSFVAWEKGEFVGRAKLVLQKERGPSRRCIGFKMTTRSAPPRPHYPIWSDNSDRPIGSVTSGTQSPSLGIGIGLGYVSNEFARTGAPLRIEIRGKFAPAEVVRKPIYRKTV
jgi:aminomethyltransferase